MGQSFVCSRQTHRLFSLSRMSNDSSSDDASTRMLDLLRPPKDSQVDRMSSTDLAYIGDVVYEMFIRSRTVWPPKRTSDLQNQVVRVVRGM